MNKSWKQYAIMHKDRKVASIRFDGSCTIYRHSFMPYNIYLEEVKKGSTDMDTRLNNLENFYHWCASRVLTLDRKYAKEIMNSLGQKQAITDRDRAQIAIAYRGLSLTDVYWIKSYGEKACFADINLYTHSLSDSFVDVSLRGKQLTAQNSELVSPEDAAGDISTMGVAPKAWVRRDGRFYLLKDGDMAEVKAELLASRIARCFRAEQVYYEPDEYDGEPVTKSELITSQEKSIVNIEYVDIYAKNHDMDYHALVLKKDAYGYYMMNIIDYLVGNTDRHWGNWGFWVNNKNNSLGKLYPLMDFNKAFTSYSTLDGVQCQTSSKKMSQKEAAIEAVRAIGLNQISEVKREWFDDEDVWNMFSRRLEVLQNAQMRNQ